MQEVEIQCINKENQAKIWKQFTLNKKENIVKEDNSVKINKCVHFTFSSPKQN